MDKLTLGLRPYLLLSLLCVAVYLPGLATVPPLDRDESRFIQATRQMLVSGDYVRIQFQNEMRAKKPVGAYWLQAASVKAFSHPLSSALWPYRLPGALAAWAAALMTFGFGKSLLGRRPALLGGGMLATALILVSEAHQAKTDAVLLACAVAAQMVLARFYVAARANEAAKARTATAGAGGGGCGGPATVRGPGFGEALVFWLAQGIAILVKGPIVPMVSLLTIVTLGLADRSWRWLVTLRPAFGSLVAAAVAAPWFVAISRATGGAFVGQAVKSDLLPKLLGSQESHGFWPGYYLLLAVVLLWPASLLAWPAMVRAWSERRRLAYRFLLAWALPTWVMFELVPTKLPHYVLPTFPAVALITGALAAEQSEVFRTRAARVYFIVWTVVGLTLAAAVAVLPARLGTGFDAGLAVAAAAIAAATLLPALLALRGRILPAAVALALTAAVAFPAVFAGVLPKLDQLWTSRAIAASVGSLGASGPIAAAGYHEPSLVVLMGTGTLLTDGAGAAAHLAAHPDTVAVVGASQAAPFFAALAADHLTPQALDRVDGFNYSRGRRVSLTIYGLTRP